MRPDLPGSPWPSGALALMDSGNISRKEEPRVAACAFVCSWCVLVQAWSASRWFKTSFRLGKSHPPEQARATCLLQNVSITTIPTVGGTAMVDKEIIEELHRLILEQTNDLWLIATGLLVFEVVVVALVLRGTKTGIEANSLAWFLSASIVACALSLGFGYAAKGALIEPMIGYASSGTWAFSHVTRLMSFLQITSVTVALALFVGAFLWKSKVIANAIVNWSKS